MDLVGRTGFSQVREHLSDLLTTTTTTPGPFEQLDVTRVSDRLLVMGRAWSHRTDKESHRNNVNELATVLNAR